MTSNYAISDFYMYLKLSIWKCGEVANWGRIDRVLSVSNTDNTFQNDYNLTSLSNYRLGKKPIEYYLKETYCKQMLANGVFLLDFYLQGEKKEDNGKYLKTYIIVISTGRFGLENREYTHVLKVSNYLNEENFASVIGEAKRARKKKSPLRKRSSSEKIDLSPIHSSNRKH